MIFLIFIIVISVATLTFVWVIRVWQASQWLRRARKDVQRTGVNTPVFVIIPVLDEAGRIEATTEYLCRTFSDPQVRIILVTTEREHEINQIGSSRDTLSVAQQLTKKFPQVTTIHYPEKTGWMAHQLNFAYQWLQKQAQFPDSIIGIYNADSRPEAETLDWILQDRQNHPDHKAWQQFSKYTNNIQHLRAQPGSTILESAAWWQTRWSIGFEIPNAMRQEALVDRGSVWYPMTYAIGHGLFLTQEALLTVHGFSEDSRNEDAILGLALSYHQIPLIPVPFFDQVEAADSVRGWITQQTNWFFGPAEAFTYNKIIRRQLGHDFHWRLHLITLELYLHALYWLFGPTFMVASIIMAAVGGFIPLFWVIMIWQIYIIIPNILSWQSVVQLRFPKFQSNRVLLRVFLFGSIPMYALHGYAAYRALWLIIWSRIRQQSIPKPKTPMRGLKGF